MPTKKRTAIKIASSGKKRQKTCQGKKSTNRTIAAAVDLTNRNSLQSPLLRLPAELRNAIWELTFGNRSICVSAQTSRRLNVPPSFHYVISASSNFNKPEKGPRLVCKQFWTETSTLFLDACTFYFHDPYCFRAFALFGGPVVTRVRRVNIFVKFSYYVEWSPAKQWARLLPSATVGRLKNLEGVQLRLHLDRLDPTMWTETDVMDNPSWNTHGLPKIIQSFQQHKLEAGLTSVEVTTDQNLYKYPNYLSDVTDLLEAIRRHLLDHHPRRISKRELAK